MAKPLLVRNSSRSRFKRCQRAWWWAYEDNLVPHRKSDPLVFGTWVHEALAEWYCGPAARRGRHPAETFLAVSTADFRNVKIWSDEDEAEWIGIQELGSLLLDEYVKYYGRDEHILIIQPEKTIRIRIPHPYNPDVRLAVSVGTVDAVYRDANTDFVWLKEHKTARSISTGHLELDEQPSTYLSHSERSLRREGLLTSQERIHGIMYNYIRKGRPDPRPKDAEGYALNKNGSRSKTQPAPLFHREAIIRTRVARKRFLLRLQQDALKMQNTRRAVAKYGEDTLMKTPHTSCNKFCEFSAMCKLEEQGGDWTTYRDTMFRRADPFEAHKSTDSETTFEFG